MIETTKRLITFSPEETFEQGLLFGLQLHAPVVVAFKGDLGAGKTTFIRGLAKSAAEISAREVCSPTFNYLNIYEGKQRIYHFDLYRIPSANEFLAAGFDEYMQSDGICCIEWSEKIEGLLPKNHCTVQIALIEEQQREIVISYTGLC